MGLRPELFETLVKLKGLHSTTNVECRRVEIILHIYGKTLNFRKFGRELGCDRETVKRWYQRLRDGNGVWVEMLERVLGEPGRAGPELRRRRLVQYLLSDCPRSGSPCSYTAEQYTLIVDLALKSPSEFGRPITHWTARELRDEVEKQNIAPGISQRQVARFLAQADLKPHKNQYWLNPKIDDQREFEERVKEICDLYLKAGELKDRGVHLVSVDEKTGIQALERINPNKAMRPGIVERMEFEYKRHGTLCLIPSFEVGSGRIIENYVGDTRDEVDFAEHIAKTVDQDPEAKWIFIMDQLNTHMSETLVRWVANRLGCKGELGVKGKSGILKSVETRRRFLGDPSHRIRFVYTPKHCSWLNQVEIWFGILVKKVLKRGSFSSKEELAQALKSFIDYFNNTMARPFKWTCKGLPLTV